MLGFDDSQVTNEAYVGDFFLNILPAESKMMMMMMMMIIIIIVIVIIIIIIIFLKLLFQFAACKDHLQVYLTDHLCFPGRIFSLQSKIPIKPISTGSISWCVGEQRSIYGEKFRAGTRAPKRRG